MSFHREMLKDREVNRQNREVNTASFPYRLVLLFMVFAVFLACSSTFGQLTPRPAPGDTSKEAPKTGISQKFPFMAEITGNNVMFRSGPGTNFYECGKLNKGDKVKVVSKQYSWYRIVPPPSSFAWISMKYVDPDSSNPQLGTLNGDRVRVYAGSNRVPPRYSTSLLGKLNKGDKVKLLGEQLDDYYKIALPPSTYLWVSAYFASPLPPEKTTPVAKEVQKEEEKDAVEKPVKPLKPGEVPKVVKIDQKPDPTETITKTLPPGPNPAVAEKVVLTTPLERYRALQKLIAAERKKPVTEQDYKQIKKDLDEIAKDEKAGKVALYAKKVYARVEALEFAISVIDQLKTQNDQLEKITSGIEKERQEKLKEVKNIGRYAVTGVFKNFVLYGKGHYQIVDNAGKMLCYALPSKEMKITDLSKFVGKRVGLKGAIQPHLPTKKAMVRFTDISLLSDETKQQAVSKDTKVGTETSVPK